MNVDGEFAAIAAWLAASTWAAMRLHTTLKDDPDTVDRYGAALPVACFGTAIVGWPWVAFVEGSLALRRWLLVWHFRRAMRRAERNAIAEVRVYARDRIREFEDALARLR